MKGLFVVPLLVLSFLSIIPTQGLTQTVSQTQTNGTMLTMTKLVTQATNLGNGCFFPIIVKINITLTQSSATYEIQLSFFWLVITTKNNIVANQTNVSYQNPNNLIQNVILFPNVPITLILSFSKTCISAINNVQLIYLDGTYNFAFALP